MNKGIAFLSLAVVGMATEGSAQFLQSTGRPIMAKDVSGRTVCWSNGHIAEYRPDGSFANSAGAKARWSVSETGVLTVGNHNYQAEVQQDGQVHLHWLVLRSHRHPVRDLWGQYCSKPLSAGAEDE